jgi:hypothetical protein
VTCDGLFSGLLEISNLIFCGRDGGVWKNMGNASRFISHHEEERRGVTGIMFLVVVDKFCHGKVLDPIKRCRAAIDAEVGF